ncbi:hypothetical protein DXG03_001290 [Asterophora parasitica]|uniref:MFS transporter n=1 Tax=Asterophora parasitica TaxID=117018 RepID=A0A9P7K9B5_9AGAR|nr:hypothetical protein DXG03_001290 [Asterophora parasitica]
MAKALPDEMQDLLAFCGDAARYYGEVGRHSYVRPTPTLQYASHALQIIAANVAGGQKGQTMSFQLAKQLQITHTQLNIVGFAGNGEFALTDYDVLALIEWAAGVYSSGPFWGRIVDLRGPQILLVSAFALLLTGYSGIRYIYDSGVPEASTTVSTLTFSLLVLCSFMTGAGGNGGLTSAVNSTAKTFPDKARATATGIVLSGFGLSAFLFSTVSRVQFAGNTSSFILLLALGTSIPMVFGFFFVRPIPLPPIDPVSGVEHGESSENPEESEENRALLAQAVIPDAPVRLSRRAALSQGLLPNVYGVKLFASTDFWLLFIILSLLSGTGLMFINNVGSMSQALYAKSTAIYNPIEAARWQADQVSAISLLNCAGRIFIGLVSDYAKLTFDLPRSYSLVIASTLFFISQILAANIDDIQNLWMASTMLGLAHGSVFAIFPNVCIEWFGLRKSSGILIRILSLTVTLFLSLAAHFSENWGYLGISPIIAGNLFSVVFGLTLDKHDQRPTESSTVLVSDATQCVLGRQCYVDALHLTTGSCFLALVLSVWASWRDRRKLAASSKRRNEAVWENNEE